VRAAAADVLAGLVPGGGPVLAVCAHPDDESFGLGAVLSTLAGAGIASAVLCFTHGEASSLGTVAGDLARLRADELAAAAATLGVCRAELLDYPDGALATVALEELATCVAERAERVRATGLVVFDEDGITGHPDHRQATAAALLAADWQDLAVVAWTVPDRVARVLNAEFGTAFVGRASHDIDATIRVDRAIQRRAIACHASQSADNPVVWRRLELLGDEEHLRRLRPRRTDR